MQLKKHSSLFKGEKFEMESSLLTSCELRSLMKIYRNFESSCVSAFDCMERTCLEAIRGEMRNRLTFSGFVRHTKSQPKRAFVAHFQSSPSPRALVWLSMKKKMKTRGFCIYLRFNVVGFLVFSCCIIFFHLILFCSLACRFFFSCSFTHVFRTLYFNFRGFWNLFHSHLVGVSRVGVANKLDCMPRFQRRLSDVQTPLLSPTNNNE